VRFEVIYVDRRCHKCGVKGRVAAMATYSAARRVAYLALCRGCLEWLLERFA